MHRKLLKATGLGLAVWSGGCCMCDAPYDYCGPTFLGGSCEYWSPDARMNSVFTPYPQPVPAGYPQEGAPQQDAPASQLEGPMEGPAPSLPSTPGDKPVPSPLPPSITQGPPARAVSVER